MSKCYIYLAARADEGESELSSAAWNPAAVQVIWRVCKAVRQGLSFSGAGVVTLWVVVMQEEELKQAGMLQGGVLTPASAMGCLLIDRLNNAGMVFKIDDAAHNTVSEE